MGRSDPSRDARQFGAWRQVVTQVLVIKNWDRFQHYKDRDPSLVKLYRDTLTSEVWVLGTDISRLLQLASTLLAARYSNRIPLNFKLLRKVASIDCTEAEFDEAIAHLVEHSFLEIQGLEAENELPASTTLAKCSSEKRREEERRGDITTREAADVPHGTLVKIRETYPAGTYRESAWLHAERWLGHLIEDGTNPADLVAASAAYGMQQKAVGRLGTQFVLSPAKFFDPRESNWRGPFPLPKSKAEVTQDGNVATVQAWLAKDTA